MEGRRKTKTKKTDKCGQDFISLSLKKYDCLFDGLHESLVTQGVGVLCPPHPLPHRLLPEVQSSKKYEFYTYSREGCNFSTVRSVPRIRRHYILSVWRILWINQDIYTKASLEVGGNNQQ